MTGTATIINAIVDAAIADITGNATTLGLTWPARVYERDEHPQAALTREILPCAYVIPVMEGGDIITPKMDQITQFHQFPITVTAYYLGRVTGENLGTDLRTIRNYAYNFVDYYRSKSGGNTLSCASNVGGGQIVGWKIDVGYWMAGGGQIVHFWIAKMNVKAYTL